MPLKTIQAMAVALFLALGAALTAQPLTLLVTGDMHGWLEPTKEGDTWVGGAAEMLKAWRDQEHLAPGQALVLACGDLFTGPAISTYFKGEPTIDAMNAMGYSASALGNHEFDFGIPKMADWGQQAQFAFLACNLTKTSASAEDLPLVRPYKIFTVQGLKVGVIGLTVRELTQVCNSQGWDGSDYVAALRQQVPRARAEGAQVVVVVGHVPFQDLKAAADQVQDLGIPVFFGGHSHETTLGRASGGAWIVNTGAWWQQYARVDLDYDAVTGKAVVRRAGMAHVRGPLADAKTQAALKLPFWQARIREKAGPTLGFTQTGLPRHWALANLVTDAWLQADPSAIAAACNDGGLRQDLPSGPVNNLQLLSVLPFEDALVAVTLTGKAFLNFLGSADKGFYEQGGELKVWAGVRQKGGRWVLDKTGKAVDAGATYRVLMNDYLANHDPASFGLPQEVVRQSWRDPMADYLKLHPSSEAQPLERVVDARPRARD